MIVIYFIPLIANLTSFHVHFSDRWKEVFDGDLQWRLINY